MEKAGFEYHPVELPVSESVQIPSGTEVAVPWLAGSRELVEEHGYGLSEPADFLPGMMSDAERKNLEYVESLSPEGQGEYSRAMTGGEDAYSAAAGDGGCVVQADLLYGALESAAEWDDSWYVEPVQGMVAALETLTGSTVAQVDFETMTAIPAQVERDQRLKELDAEWASCMRRSGLSRGAELWSASEPLGPVAAFGLAISTGADGSVLPQSDKIYQAGEIPADQQSLIGSQYEVEIAVADFDCRAETDYLVRYTKIQFDLETDYVAAHREELEKLVATWQQRQSD
ncbi:MAG: hypothetical protein LBD77_00920 [Bifidobacteriaceae bacterium]|nr:hypothetical protein [Bifidobacteriaceae bacterium]